MRSGSRVMLSCTPAGGFGRFLVLLLGSLLGSFWGTIIGPSNAAFALAMTPVPARTWKRMNKGEDSTSGPPGSTSKKDQSVLSRPRSTSPASQEPSVPRSRRCKKIGTAAAATMGLAAATTGLAAVIGNSSAAVGTTPTGLKVPADASRWGEGGTELLAQEQTCTTWPYTDPCVISVPFGQRSMSDQRADVRSACRNDRQKETGGENKIEPLRVCHDKAFTDPNHGKATLEPGNSCAGSSPSTSSLEIAEIGFFKDAAAASAQQAKFEKLPGYIPEKNEVHLKLTKEEVKSLSRRLKSLTPVGGKHLFEAEANTIRNILRRAGVKLANAKEDVEGEARVYRVRAVDEIGAQFSIKCKNVWVWKSACLSCLSGMTLKSVDMHVTQELHFSVMQERSLSCRIGNT